MTKHDPLSDAALEEYHALEMVEQQFDISTVKTALSKLSVKELRVLAAHYWQLEKRELSNMRKPELVNELAFENTKEILRGLGL